MQTSVTRLATSITLLLCNTAALAVEPGPKCEASKSKTVGGYYACLGKVRAKSILKEVMPDFTACSDKFSDKWAKAEAKGAEACPGEVEATGMRAFLDAQESQAAGLVAGTSEVPECGDGDVNTVGEHCDGADLDGYACTSFGWPAGTLACTDNCDFDASGCTTCTTGVTTPGVCWTIGNLGQSCDAACADIGMDYDVATRDYAGSGGTDAQCGALLDAFLGDGPDPVGAGCADMDFDVGYGCNMDDFFTRGRCTTPDTTSTAALFHPRYRVCGCSD